MKKTCETCGCQVYDPFGGTLKLHDEEKCRGSQLEYKSNTPRTKCTCLDDNKLTQALCPIHGTPTPRTNYNHVSHTHCWEQGGHPPCGIPMEKHTQCCLCDLKVPRPRTWEDIMVTDLFMLCVEWSKGNFDMGKTIRERILAKISTIEDEAVRREKERIMNQLMLLGLLSGGDDF